MNSLIFLSIIGLAAAAPQPILPYSMGVMPFTHVSPYVHSGIMPIHSGIMPYMSIGSQDMMLTSVIPKPVEDTPEVKLAKHAFAVEYQKELMGIRQKRDLTGVMPVNTMPYASTYSVMPYMTHAQMVGPVIDNTHLYARYSTPVVTRF